MIGVEDMIKEMNFCNLSLSLVLSGHWLAFDYYLCDSLVSDLILVSFFYRCETLIGVQW